MKVIRINNTIVSLENMRNVELQHSGSGAKSNPYKSCIIVEYRGDTEDTRVWFDDNAEQTIGEQHMAAILKILSEG